MAMAIETFLAEMNSGRTVVSGSEVHQCMKRLSQEALKITAELNCGYHDPSEVRKLFSRLTGEALDSNFGLFPPFYTDCGKNLHVGKNVFINSGCKFQDQGGIYIGDGALIGHNVVMATLNHSEDPEKRGNLHPAPIHIGKNVWIGSNSVVCPGVRIGDNSVVAAGAVVIKDVPENTVVGGVPARFIKNIGE